MLSGVLEQLKAAASSENPSKVDPTPMENISGVLTVMSEDLSARSVALEEFSSLCVSISQALDDMVRWLRQEAQEQARKESRR